MNKKFDEQQSELFYLYHYFIALLSLYHLIVFHFIVSFVSCIFA
jgi:hypothetical protein